MWFLGTNDQPGDYRSSGCTACHVVYANDREPRHSGPYARFGHGGHDARRRIRPSRRDERGHPLRHGFTRAIPTGQCMVCHMHQPNMFVNTYLGYTMWDYESDAPSMWPEKQQYPTDARDAPRSSTRNPEEAAIARQVGRPRLPGGGRPTLNPTAQGHPVRRLPRPRLELPRRLQARPQGQAARRGRQAGGRRTIRDKFKKAVHLSSIHVDKGMHCVDCHFEQDAHGNGHIYGEVAAGGRDRLRGLPRHDATRYPNLYTSGPAAPPGGTDLSAAAHAGRPRGASNGASGKLLPALGARARQGVGGVAGEGHASIRTSRVQREGGAGED